LKQNIDTMAQTVDSMTLFRNTGDRFVVDDHFQTVVWLFEWSSCWV